MKRSVHRRIRNERTFPCVQARTSAHWPGLLAEQGFGTAVTRFDWVASLVELGQEESTTTDVSVVFADQTGRVQYPFRDRSRTSLA